MALEVEALARRHDRLFKAWDRTLGTKTEQDERWEAYEDAHAAWVAKSAELREMGRRAELKRAREGQG